MACNFLIPLGFNVLAAPNAAEVLHLCGDLKDKVDLLVTDVIMPGIDGFELASQLRQKIPKLKVIFVSGYSDDSLSFQGQRFEGCDFLKKPYTLAALCEKIRESLDR